jgi:hypothetical protein
MKQSKFTRSIDTVLISISFIIFIISVLVMRDTIIIKYRIENHILQNLLTEPIYGITVGRNACDDDYEQFYSFEYPGVPEGSFHNKTKEFIEGEHCNDDEDCIEIPEVPFENLTLWKDKVLCLQRFEPGSYDNIYSIVNSDASCPEGTRQCGYYNKYLDKLCFEVSISCPVNYIAIEQERRRDENYTSIYLTNNTYLVYSSAETEQIVPIEFFVSEYTPCVESDRYSYNPEVGYFPFEFDNEYYGCNRTDYDSPVLDIGFDYRYRAMDVVKKKDFLIENDLWKKYATLPDIPGVWDLTKDINSKMYLFGKGYNSISMKCVSHDEFTRFTYNLYRNKLFSFQHLCGCLSNLIIICLFVSLLSLFKFEKKYKWIHLATQYIKITFNITFLVFNFSYTHRGISKIQQVAVFLNKILLHECVDDEVLYAFNRYSLKWYFSNSHGYLNMYYIFSSIYALGVFMQLIRLIYKTFTRVKRKRTLHAKAKEKKLIIES